MDFISLTSLAYVFLGLFVGFLSGFLGIGGGAAAVPILMLFGFDIKYAIGISVLQMVFSSVFGSFFNLKNKSIDLRPALFLGFGGACGAVFSGFIVSYVSSKILLLTLICIQIFNLIKLFLKNSEPKGEPNNSVLPLFFIGLFSGSVAISVGIGGSVIIMPILINFLNYDIKKAVATGLFFVIFSSISGFISLASQGLVHYEIGILVGIGSLISVRFGVELARRIDRAKQKLCLIALLIVTLLIMVNKLFS
ncbi:MAG: sulfite exporter TauE/SafE family protein [Campylobacter sp.]